MGTAEIFRISDPRRDIDDYTFPFFDFPFNVKQVKIITISEKAVTEETPIGEHYHTQESGRWELFLVIGKEIVPLFKLRLRRQNGEIEEREMKPGDFCVIEPGCSHSFVGLKPGAQLLGFSNLPYESSHDIDDKLFWLSL